MHNSAMKRMEWFVKNYIPTDRQVKVLDVGSYDVNGCYKQLFSNMPNVSYVGADVSAGPNVDTVLEYPYCWIEFDPDSFDFIISGNAFEHIEYPWASMEQIHDKLKPGGITCILTPFSHKEHKYPTDCYRYFPDGMIALAKWANLDVINCTTGGVPEKELPPDWAKENYDDTMLIAGKDLTKEQIDSYPKLKSEVRTKIWK